MMSSPDDTFQTFLSCWFHVHMLNQQNIDSSIDSDVMWKIASRKVLKLSLREISLYTNALDF